MLRLGDFCHVANFLHLEWGFISEYIYIRILSHLNGFVTCKSQFTEHSKLKFI